MSVREIYEELLIDKTKRAKALVEKAKGILGIDKDTGEPLILVSRSKLTDRLLISLYLCGKYFASELGLVESPSATLEELSKKLGISKAVISARITELKREGKIRMINRGEYAVIFSMIGSILDEAREKIGD